MKVIKTAGEVTDLFASIELFHEDPPEYVIFLNIDFNKVPAPLLLRGNLLSFENLSFINCTLLNGVISIFAYNTVRIINCDFSGSTVSITHVSISKEKGSVCILNSIIGELSSVDRFLNLYIVNSSLDRVGLEDIVHKKYRVFIVKSDINDIFLGRIVDFERSVTPVCGESLFIEDSNVNRLLICSRDSYLLGIDGDCATVCSIKDPKVRNVVFGGSISDSDLREIPFEKFSFDMDNSIFLRCNVSNIDLRHLNIEETSDERPLKDKIEIKFYDCIGVDTVEFPDNSSITHVVEDCIGEYTLLTCWRVPSEDNRQSEEIS